MKYEINQKKIIIAAICIILVIAAIFFKINEEKVLRVGIFAGSNWNVPQGETYAIIDEVIKKFEIEYPNVKVEYVSGIKKEDYAEWLAEQFIDGNEPDVFFLLSDDFNLYVSMGALMDLSGLIEDDENFDANVYYPATFKYGEYEKNHLRCHVRVR